MSFARKLRRARAPADAKCAECGKRPELGVTSSEGRVLLFCRPCARELAKRLDLPELRRQLGEDAPS
jgi:ribosomal protein S14